MRASLRIIQLCCLSSFGFPSVTNMCHYYGGGMICIQGALVNSCFG